MGSILLKPKCYGMILIELKSLLERLTTQGLWIAKIADKYWSEIITYRGEKIMIISVHRSRKEEVEVYES